MHIVEAPRYTSRCGRQRYGDVYAAIMALDAGQAVCVPVASRQEAKRLASAARMRFRLGRDVQGKRVSQQIDNGSVTLWLVDCDK